MTDKKEERFRFVLSFFKVIRIVNGVAYCICPSHSDNKPSLHISMGDKKIVLDCKARCSFHEILERVGLKPCQLYYDYSENSQDENLYVSKRQYFLEHYSLDRYDNQNICTGEYTHTKYRTKGKNGEKQFSQGHYKDGIWIDGLGGVDTSLSVFCNGHIKELKQALTDKTLVCYCEGEKDAKILWKYGFISFTCGAVRTFHESLLPYLKGGKFVVFADNDAAGIADAKRITSMLSAIGSATMIIPPVLEKGDISDFMEFHSKEDLQRLVDDALNNTVTENRIESSKQEIASTGQIDLMKFHIVGDNGKITGVYHNAVFEYIKSHYDMFICGGTPYIYSGGYFMADMSGARLKSIIRELIYPHFIKSTTINNIYALFLQDISIEVDFEQLNCYPSHWICFQNGMWDCKEKRLLPHSPKYRAINQIPHEYKSSEVKFSGERTEEYLNFICEESDSREMLLQFIGYSLTKDTNQQKFLVLNGKGGTGKSTVIRLVEALVGSRNVSNISLTDLQQRFASFGLMAKLLNSCADLEISALEDTSIIKKVLGEDTLRAEQKGRDAISFKSYAKLIFSTNELPLVKSEKTNGFYRRLLVLTMNKMPEHKNPNLFCELLQEIDYLLQLVVQAVERMYQQEVITVSEASEKAVLQLWNDSDTVQAFLNDVCVNDELGRMERTELYRQYANFCEDTDRQSLTKNNFYKSLRVKGYSEIKTGGYRYFKGISYLKDCSDLPLKTAPDGFISISQEQMDESPFQ